MLILSRKKGETIFVNDEVTVTVLEAHKNRVKLGIAAQNDISVLREEVYFRTMAEKAAYGRSDAENEGE